MMKGSAATAFVSERKAEKTTQSALWKRSGRCEAGRAVALAESSAHRNQRDGMQVEKTGLTISLVP